MKKKILLMLISLGASTVAIYAGGGSKDYYFKTTVSAKSGQGTVYASTTNSEGTYAQSITVNPAKKSASSTPTTNIYVWAKANAGYDFIGWDCPTASFSNNVAAVDGNTSSTFVNQVKALFIPTGSKIFQIENSDFEGWDKYGDDDHAPDNWNSFETLKPNGSLTEMAKAQQVDKSTDVRPGSTGSYSAKIYSRNVVIANAQGNLTTGRINAGSTSPANAANHNFTDVSNGAFNQYFGAHPDSVKVWVKFVPKDASYYARLAITTHDAYNYITYGQESDNTTTNESHAYAHAALNFSATSDKGWQQLTIPFTLTGNSVEPTYIVANFSTNNTPGGGSDSDNLYIDDMELVYNSEIASATYNGVDIYFTNGAANVDAIYNESELDVTTTSLANAATIEKEYNDETGVLTITVKGEDISMNASNYHTYTIQFQSSMVVRGDLSGNGIIDQADIPLLAEILVGRLPECEEADINEDGVVSLKDLTMLVDMVK